MSTTTTTTRDRGDHYGPIKWAHKASLHQCLYNQFTPPDVTQLDRRDVYCVVWGGVNCLLATRAVCVCVCVCVCGWRAAMGEFCPTSLGRPPTSLQRLDDDWHASLMLDAQVTCDSQLRQIVYFRGSPDGTAFAGVWRQLAVDEYVLKHRVALPPAAIGIHRVDLADALPVERGDFLGVHYPRDGGGDGSRSGGVVVHSVPGDSAGAGGGGDAAHFYQTLVVDASDEDFPVDRTVQLSEFDRRLESRAFALQAILVPDSLGQSSTSPLASPIVPLSPQLFVFFVFSVSCIFHHFLCSFLLLLLFHAPFLPQKVPLNYSAGERCMLFRQVLGQTPVENVFCMFLSLKRIPLSGDTDS